MTAEETKLLADYKAAQDAALAWKTYEQGLRKRVVAAFGSAEKYEGTERKLLDTGDELVMRKVCNYIVHNENGQVYYLRVIIPADTFNDLFTESWSISITAYRALTDAQRAVIDYALEIRPGMPTLKIEATGKVI